MKEIFTDQDSTRVGYFKSLLEAEGIACYVRNELSNQLAEIPIRVFYPVLCIISDGDYNRAQGILEPYRRALTAAPDWKCPKCQSLVPAGFETCWNCQSERPTAVS